MAIYDWVIGLTLRSVDHKFNKFIITHRKEAKHVFYIITNIDGSALRNRRLRVATVFLSWATRSVKYFLKSQYFSLKLVIQHWTLWNEYIGYRK